MRIDTWSQLGDGPAQLYGPRILSSVIRVWSSNLSAPTQWAVPTHPGSQPLRSCRSVYTRSPARPRGDFPHLRYVRGLS